MSVRERTKNMFADELEQMLQTIPLDKLRILDFCDRCDATPPTFYYYFHDKYELVAWIFLQDFLIAFNTKTPNYSSKTIIKSLEQMNKRRVFYQKAYRETSQNSINTYIQKFNVQISKIAFKEINGGIEMSKEQILHVKYHSYGIMGLFKEWLYNDSDVNMNDIAELQYKNTPEFMKLVFQKYSFPKKRIMNLLSRN